MFIESLKGPDTDTQYTDITFFKKGGMGEIYKSHDSVNDIDVAIKLIPIDNSNEEELLYREVKVSKELTAENLVTTYYTDETEQAGTKYFYIVQHFYEHGNMRSLIKKDVPLTDCLKMMLALLNGLNVLHTKIVHRDLKPENILVDDNNNLLITDFGLAKFIHEKTRTKSFKGYGTIPYLAPECWLNEINTIQMDIYSLGILFYEILTGEFPFKADNETEWRDCHLYEQMPDISQVRNDIPVKIKQIISKMTQKRSRDRYNSTREIISALNESIQIANENNLEIEKLASIHHTKSEENKSRLLKQEQEKERIEEHKKFLNYHITELVNQMKNIVELFNSTIEDNQIIIKEHRYNGYLTERSFSISINRIFASFKFYEHNVIENYEEERLARIKNRIRTEQISMFSGIPESIFTKKDIIYLGMVETNYKSPKLNEKFGFNLVLVKDENESYGTWYIAKFSDSAFSRSNRKDFALDLEYFFQEFENSFITHSLSVDFRELKDKDLHRLIEEILI